MKTKFSINEASLGTKLLFLISVPIVLLAISVSRDIYQKTSVFNEMSKMSEIVVNAQTINKYISELQKERGRSVVYSSNKNRSSKKSLDLQRIKTDSVKNAFLNESGELSNEIKTKLQAISNTVNDLREKIDNDKILKLEILKKYTQLTLSILI